ncbi:phospholipid scramblase-related protein [Lipingzhangella sp. LS1_29]|uniref:Phospholipid scramblase-related protein n=1 Tax=Lipingzhangella rawalii TaxID=2055835 RepID=A0ABU2H4J1_9ACTN|nr:phospholipid scramblase-related protein [Lipingzhangella rawalii]MDS1270211.1 phospholipid scramblase-related protein [Lipingzhangella rawalii]
MVPLYASPVLMVEQPRQLFQDSYYQVFDTHGQPVAHVREAAPAGDFIGSGRHRPHRFHIVAPDGEPLLVLDKPWQWGRPHIYVTSGYDGTPVGTIVQDLTFLGSRFWLQDGHGRTLGQIEGNWNSCDFRITGADGREVARINKHYTGLFSGEWGTESRYALQFAHQVQEPLRTLVVAAAITVDVMLHERDESFYHYGPRRRWRGDPFYYGTSGYWGPRSGWRRDRFYYGGFYRRARSRPRGYYRRGYGYPTRRSYGPARRSVPVGRRVVPREPRPDGQRVSSATRSGGVARRASAEPRRANDSVERRSRTTGSRGSASAAKSGGLSPRGTASGSRAGSSGAKSGGASARSRGSAARSGSAGGGLFSPGGLGGGGRSGAGKGSRTGGSKGSSRGSSRRGGLGGLLSGGSRGGSSSRSRRGGGRKRGGGRRGGGGRKR